MRPQRSNNSVERDRKMKTLVALLLALVSISVHADAFYVLVGYICDKKQDQILLTYDGAYNDAGKEMVANKRDTQWDPWRLVIAKDDDHIGSLMKVKRKCQLSDGTYDITLMPSPGNFNVQGRCGAWMTASAEVRKGKNVIYTVRRFESDCHDMETPITMRVAIKPKSSSPSVTVVPWEEFYK